MEQTPHAENPFPGNSQKIDVSLKNKPMLFGLIALIVIVAGVIWYISDTSTSAPVAPLPPQAVAPAKPAVATVNVPLADTGDLPAVEASLGSMDANLKTLDDLKDI